MLSRPRSSHRARAVSPAPPRVAAVIAAVIAGLISAGPACRGAESALRAVRLRCEYLTDPLGIDVARPRLSWELESTRRGDRQTAYRVLVATSEAVLRSGRGDVWDSGRTESDESVHVAYGGPELPSATRVHWAVRVWDHGGSPSAWSEPAWWETGLLHRSDWQAQWIGAPWGEETLVNLPYLDRDVRWIRGSQAKDAASGEREPARTCFRGRLELPAGIRIARATLVMAAADRFRVWVNGREAGSGGLRPYLTALDIAGDLDAGSRDGGGRGRNAVNVIAVEVTGGDGGPAVAGKVVVETASGGAAVELVTGASWKAAERPAGAWTARAFDDSGWSSAREAARFGEPPWGRIPLPPRAGPAPMLQRIFTLEHDVESARVYICGLGYHELYINGRRVGDHRLDPGYTRYDRRALYVTHDVTRFLRRGRNAVGIILGNGWYNTHARDVWDFHEAPWRALPCALLRLDVSGPGGARTAIVSDGSWRATSGPIVFDGIRNGETYDARREVVGWAAPDADLSSWRPARLASGPAGVLSAQMQPPIRVTETLRPVGLTEPRPGVFIYDLGQNIAGWARLTVSGPAGTRVVMRYGERLHPDGTLDREKIDTFVFQGPFQTDTYILKGEGVERWEPRFTYHGFRYVEVTGYPGRPRIGDLEGRVAHTDFERIGSFECSNALFNRVVRDMTWSYRGNFHSIPTDCPHREKNGWMGDALLSADVGLLFFDNAAGYTKWVRDIRDEQRPTGELPGIVPTGGWGYAWGNGPAWESALILVPWSMYLYVGDRRILEESYEHFRRSVDWFSSRDYMRRNPSGWLGDWVPVKERCPEAVTHAGYHFVDARITAFTARLLGRDGEAARYDAVAEKVRSAFYARFVDREARTVAGGLQTAHACALFQRLARTEDRAWIAAGLVANVESKGGHLDCGILGTRYILDALTATGHADVAYRIADQRDYPGWGHWIELGATTLWEDWAGDNSRNHIFLGDVCRWYVEAIAGLRPDPAAPGFKRIVVEPHLLGGLAWARAETRTVRGAVASRWRREGGTFTLDVTVPPGSTATVRIPARDPGAVRESGRPLSEAEGVRLAGEGDGRVVVEALSGRYVFSAPDPTAGG